MLTAITRPVSASINRCELGYLQRREIDVRKAAAQHTEYEAALTALGLRVLPLAPEPDLPDAVFVEDAAVVVDEAAVITRMGALSRRPEADSVARELARHRPIQWLAEPATLDGGDVMHAESAFYVGVSKRTNPAGIRQLAAALEPFGYSVAPVEVRDCLHMKSACCYLGERTILANRAWIDPAPFRDFRILDVADDEPWAANVLAIGESVILPSCFPATRRILERAGYNVIPLDVSEIMKAEGGVTCMSLIFDNAS
jgi:dimethylargininase